MLEEHHWHEFINEREREREREREIDMEKKRLLAKY